MSAKTAPGPRERLLAAGQQLFYSRGASVGVDALLKEANVARRSLYEHFGGKDGLVAAVLRRASDEDLAWYEDALAGATDPEPGCSGSSTGSTSSSRTRTSEAVGTSRPTSHSPIPTIRHMQRPRRTGGAFAHSSFGSSRRWAMPTRSTLPSSCTC